MIVLDALDEMPKNSEILGYISILTTDEIFLLESQLARYKQIIITLIMITLFFAMIYYAWFRVDASIRRLMVSAERVAKGEGDITLSEAHLIRELALFARSFNKIVAINKQREEDNDRKIGILEIVAHELRTPMLGAIRQLNFLQSRIQNLLPDQNDNAESRECNRSIEKALADLRFLDNRSLSILNLTAINNGDFSGRFDWVNVKEFFNELMQRYTFKIEALIDVELYCVSDLSPGIEAYIEDVLISSVIGNAIENAIKFTTRGHISVHYEISSNSDEIVITVSDSGIGMTEMELDVLTSNKGRASGAFRSRGGWGVGVSTMYKFADYLKGSLEFFSKKNIGTNVVMTFPTKIQENQDSINNCDITAGNIITRNALGARKNIALCSETKSSHYISVLIIDDDPTILQDTTDMVIDALGADNVCITSVNSAYSAVSHIGDQFFDVLLVDFHMKGMNGKAFLEHIDEEDNACKSSYKVIVTADTSTANSCNHTKNLADDIIDKGFSIPDLKTMFRKVRLQAV